MVCPIDFVKHDLQVSVDGLAWLKKVLDNAKDDVTTYDMLKDYYKDVCIGENSN